MPIMPEHWTDFVTVKIFFEPIMSCIIVLQGLKTLYYFVSIAEML